MRIDTSANRWQAAPATPAAAQEPTAQSAFAAALAQTEQATAAPEHQDFRHITPTQLRDTVNTLIRSGQMGLHETSALLGFMHPQLAVADGQASARDDAPMNVYAKIQAGIEGALSRHDLRHVESLQAAAAALRRFQT